MAGQVEENESRWIECCGHVSLDFLNIELVSKLSISSYVHWALHNPKDDGNYNWEGIADVERFVELATEEDLYILLRPGPYVSVNVTAQQL